MIYINFVELLSVTLHAKFRNHRPSGSGEEDLDHLYKLSFPLPKDAAHEVWVSEEIFEIVDRRRTTTDG